jgi:hypothetical protein
MNLGIVDSQPETDVRFDTAVRVISEGVDSSSRNRRLQTGSTHSLTQFVHIRHEKLFSSELQLLLCDRFRLLNSMQWKSCTMVEKPDFVVQMCSAIHEAVAANC